MGDHTDGGRCGLGSSFGTGQQLLPVFLFESLFYSSNVFGSALTIREYQYRILPYVDKFLETLLPFHPENGQREIVM